MAELAGAPQVGPRRGPDVLPACEQQLAERPSWWAGEPCAVFARHSSTPYLDGGGALQAVSALCKGAGASGSPEFEGLRTRVGLPAQAPDPSVDALSLSAEHMSTLLHALGVQKRGQSGIAPAEAARSFLASAEAQARVDASFLSCNARSELSRLRGGICLCMWLQDLRMRDLERMLLDYQAQTRGGRAAGPSAGAVARAAAADGAWPRDAPGGPAAGQFCHMAAGDLRLSDVQSLQLGYRGTLQV